MNFWRKKIRSLSFLVVTTGLVIVLLTPVANAQSIKNAIGAAGGPLGLILSGSLGSFIDGILGGVIGWIAFVIIYIQSLIAGMLFSFGGFLIEWLLELNIKVLDLPTVQLGWEIMLNVANLGFVLAIIVIAFATIFRRETYAMKQTLWKLVVAALLVNFSLVIAGGLIETSHIFANFFIDKATPTVGSQQNGIIAFVDALTAGIAPQKLLAVKGLKDGKMDELKGSFGTTGVSSAAANLIISMFFISAFVLIGAIVFLAIAIMLLIRFVALGILLILAPIVWLFWIFPSTKHLWDQWWGKFIRWTFFAPIMLFFLYLVIKTNEKKGVYFTSVIEKARIAEGQAGVIKAMEKDLLINDPLLVLGQMVIMLGLMVGGLIVANKMSITFSSTAINWASGTGKWARAAAGRRGLQWGTSPLRAQFWKDEEGKRTKSAGEKAVEWSNKNWLTRHTLGYVAKGMTRLETAGGENILKQHAGAAAGMSETDLKASVLTASGPRKIAIMKELQKRKSLGDVDAKNLITEENKSLFGRFRQGMSWGDVEHGAKMNVKIAEELKNTGKASGELLKEFVKTYKGKDIEASAIKDLYSGRAKLGLSRDAISELGIVFADAFANVNHQVVPRILPTMNAKELNNFSAIYEWAVNSVGGKPKEAWENTMKNYSMGFSAETPTTGTFQPPPKP